MKQKIGFGGGCHWCTEAVFDALRGVEKVLQGWISSTRKDARSFSEAVIVLFDGEIIPLEVLVEIHLRTHSSTSMHSMRSKYRSAIYTFNKEQENSVKKILESKADIFEKKIVTEVLEIDKFKLNKSEYLGYYKKNSDRAFCKNYIDPKLMFLKREYSRYTR